MKTSSSLHLRKRELFGYLGYEPHPGQVEVHRSRAPRRILACGVRWGKSTCAAMEAVAALMVPRERSIGWVVAPSYDLTERIFGRVREVVEGRLAHRVQEVNPRDRRIVIRNLLGGVSELRGKSADQPVSLLGEGLDWLVVDEAARLSEEVWTRHLSQRLIDRKGWALLLSTPRGADWFYHLYRRGLSGRDPDYAAWAKPSWDNPMVDRALIEAEWPRLPAGVFEQEYAARFLGEEQEPCAVCDGPSPDAPGIVIMEQGQEFLRCKACGKPVNEEGSSLVKRWPDGTAYLKRIILARRPKAPPPEEPFLNLRWNINVDPHDPREAG